MNPLSRKWLLLVLLAVPFLLGGAWWLGASGIGNRPKDPWPQKDTPPQRDPKSVMVTVAAVKLRSVQRTVEALGTFHGYEEVTISAKVEGRVRKILHEVADRVPPDELLLEVDPTEYELAVRQADQGLQVELSKLGLAEIPGPGLDLSKIPSVAQAGVRMNNTKTRLNRALNLDLRKGISQEDLDDRSAEFKAAQAEYENQLLIARTGVATIHFKKEALAVAKQQLRETLIRVPVPSKEIPGVKEVAYAITHRSVAEGSYVRAGAEVFKLVIDRPVKLRVLVPERHSSEIKLGQKGEVFVAAYATPFSGVVTRVNPSVDPATRTLETEIQLANPAGELKPGGFAKAVIFTRTDAGAATVPLEAPVTFAGITKIFRVENGKAKEVRVTLGIQGQTWVEVTSPALPADTLVITSGQSALADDTPVIVRKE